MVRSSRVVAIVLSASMAFAQSCSQSSHCPQSAPCCSQYGKCGVGAYCLGGCDPISSFSLDSCVPAPVCQSKRHSFQDLSRIVPNTKYLGDPSTADWVSSGQPVAYQDNVLLTMAPDTVGTLLASTTYIWYGNVKATFKTSRGQGVVTAFILLSDVKDEIDYEFVGVDLSHAQSNYYFQGATNYVNSANISLSDTFNNYHTYEIDWTPDEIIWKVDGQVGRRKKRAETWNATANQWAFPQTPARVELSLWPAGLASNGKGTIEWAGGLVDWNSADIKGNNYYYAAFQSVDITCYDPKSGPGSTDGTSYTYSSNRGTNDTVAIGNKATALKSFLGTGLDMDAGAPTKSGATPTTISEAVPGISGGNPGVDTHNDDSGASSSGGSATGGFSQGGMGSSQSGAERTLKESLLAVIIAVAALMVL